MVNCKGGDIKRRMCYIIVNISYDIERMLLLIPNGYVGAQGGAQTSVSGLVLLFSQ